MRRITIVFVTTIAAVVLLFSYRTSLHSGRTTGAVAAAPRIVGGSDPTPAPTTVAKSAAPSAASSPRPAAPKTVTVDGAAVDTQWGPVQVEVTLRGTRITHVNVVQQPSGNRRDLEINSYAIPQLTAETLQAQSAQIDTVSGASVTSGGYIQSLQSALDLAAGRR